jgi:hypothetical protein
MSIARRAPVTAAPLRLAATVVMLAALGVSPGCAYTQHAAKDFGEVFHIGIGISTTPGVKLSMRASVLVLMGAWMPDSWYVGSDHGAAYIWRERAYGFPFATGLMDRWYDQEPTPSSDQEVDAYLSEDVFFVVSVPIEDTRLEDLAPRMQLLVRGSQLEMGVHLVFVGASLGINVAQACDFAGALLGFDPLGDAPVYEEF